MTITVVGGIDIDWKERRECEEFKRNTPIASLRVVELTMEMGSNDHRIGTFMDTPKNS